MIPLARLIDIATVIGDNVSEVIFTDWNIRTGINLQSLRPGASAFLIHENVTTDRKITLVEQLYQSSFVVSADILFKLQRYHNEIDLATVDSITESVYGTLENRDLYVGEYQQINILNDRVYYDNALFGTTVQVEYKFRDDFFDADNLKTKWNLLHQKWNTYHKRFNRG